MKELRPINTSIFIAFMIFANAGVAGEPLHAAGAKDVTLGPGERLEFPSGSLVYGNWRILGGGTAERPAVIATARGGNGPARLCNPTFTNDFGRILDIRAKHVVVENLVFENGTTPTPDRKADPDFLGPMHRLVPELAAVLIETNAAYVTVRNCEFASCPIGVRVRGTDSAVVSNRFHDAHKISERWGAIAVTITGSRLELSHNEIRDYGFLGGMFEGDGAAFEVDGEDPTCQGREITDLDIHHNRAWNVQGGFMEVTRPDVRRVRLADNFSDCQDKFVGFLKLAHDVTLERNVIWHRRLPRQDLLWGAVTNAVFRDNRVVFRTGTHFDRNEAWLRRKGYSLDYRRSGNVYASTAPSAADFFRGEALAADERYVRVDASVVDGPADDDAWNRADARPETWFHLIGGNVSRTGLEADLDAIRDAGISGIQLFHGQFGKAETWPGGGEPVPCLSEEWEKMIAFAAEGCANRGLGFKMQNCPGWSMSGGPWVAPSNAMRQLTYSRTDVCADGSAVDIVLPSPDSPSPEVKISESDRDYRDLFVLAFPTPAGDAAKPVVSDTKPLAIGEVRTYRFESPRTVRTLVVPSPSQISVSRAYEPNLSVRLEAETSEGAWTTVVERAYPQGNWQDETTFSIACDETAAKAFRITFSGKKGTVPYVRLFSAARRDNWEGLAAWTLRGLVSNTAAPRQAPETWLCADRIVDITACLTNGRLRWTPPQTGDWTILRIGHVNAGLKNAPAPEEATGWECDKLDPSGIDCVFDGYIGHFVQGVAKGRLQGAILDSWECRRQTWTPKMETYFRQANGYDIRRLLPAVFGWVIDNPGWTERLLLDWRRTIGDLCEKNYYGRFAERCRAAGLTADFETAFGDVFPGDLMAFWKHADVPMCEFWSPHGGHFLGCDEFKPVRPCVSAAHVYGKRRVAAESFTVMGRMWFEDFLFFKEIANRYFARGITHLVFHTYTHNPATDGKLPGTSFGAEIGRPFLRGQTWWPYLKELTGYFTRCCERLERGCPASDILWYLGDDLDHKPSERSPFGNKYQYDYLNHDALMTRISVRDGMFVTPEGVSWRVLWVPNVHLLRDDTREKLAALSAAGGRVVYGDAKAATAGLAPDCQIRPEASGSLTEEDSLDWLHRREGTRDVYFVSTLQPEGFSGTVRFRAKGAVRLYDAVTDEECPADVTACDESGVEIRLKLLRGESRFVMIEGGGGQGLTALPGDTREEVWQSVPDCRVSISGPWMISFPFGWGAPASIETSVLKPWKDLPLGDEGRTFSGTATYKTVFARPSSECVWLDLGDVDFIADVRVNGRPVRVLWAPPYRCEVSDHLIPGENVLEVKVTSNWYNRLVYDAGLPEEERKTWTIAPPKPGSPLRNSGLLGPVRLMLK